MVSIRPACLDDLPDVRAINTHYILHTSVIFTQYPPPSTSYADAYRRITARGLPYLVAVNETTQVVGYAYLAPYRGERLSYAPTVELSVFVHPDHQSRAIGSRLLAALLDKVQAGEVRNRASEITGDGEESQEIHAGDNGDGAVVRNVLAVMSVDPEGKDGGDALRRWYLRRGFVQAGRLEKIGQKWGRWIDTVYLQYQRPE